MSLGELQNASKHFGPNSLKASTFGTKIRVTNLHPLFFKKWGPPRQAMSARPPICVQMATVDGWLPSNRFRPACARRSLSIPPILSKECRSTMALNVNALGGLGENIFAVLISNFTNLPSPLFKPAFLGEKWPTADFYVEVEGNRNPKPYFLVQVKTTRSGYNRTKRRLYVSVARDKLRRLARIPAPTYLVAIYQPLQRGYILAIRSPSTPGISSVPLRFSLTPSNLRRLRQEVIDFWQNNSAKPAASRFE